MLIKKAMRRGKTMSKNALRLVTIIAVAILLTLRTINVVFYGSESIMITLFVGAIAFAILLVTIWNEFYR